VLARGSGYGEAHVDEQTHDPGFEEGTLFPWPSDDREGTGLGPATVFGVIKQSEGSISVSSKPGRGTTFEIYLPAAQTVAAPMATRSVDEASLRGRETILVVEDEQSVRQLVVRVLSRAGYTVLQAGSAAEAEQALEEGGAPDLVLSDMVLPGGVNGRTLSHRIREKLPRAKVIFMSGYAHDVVEGDRAEEWAHFIGKPFTPAALLEQVRAAMGEGE
jgi:two-component system, cell cycle sensor histidine kinase and response regulator CckA